MPRARQASPEARAAGPDRTLGARTGRSAPRPPPSAFRRGPASSSGANRGGYRPQSSSCVALTLHFSSVAPVFSTVALGVSRRPWIRGRPGGCRFVYLGCNCLAGQSPLRCGGPGRTAALEPIRRLFCTVFRRSSSISCAFRGARVLRSAVRVGSWYPSALEMPRLPSYMPGLQPAIHAKHRPTPKVAQLGEYTSECAFSSIGPSRQRGLRVAAGANMGVSLLLTASGDADVSSKRHIESSEGEPCLSSHTHGPVLSRTLLRTRPRFPGDGVVPGPCAAFLSLPTCSRSRDGFEHLPSHGVAAGTTCAYGDGRVVSGFVKLGRMCGCVVAHSRPRPSCRMARSQRLVGRRSRTTAGICGRSKACRVCGDSRSQWSCL